MRQEIWICLVEVVALTHCVDIEMKGAGGAYVNAIIPARNRRAAKDKVEDALDRLGYELMSLRDLETVRSRLRNDRPSHEIRRLARQARRTGQVQFDAFYFWPEGEVE